MIMFIVNTVVVSRGMKAARWHGQGDIRVEDIEEQTVGPDDVRIDVEACGICGSDLHEYVAGPIFIPADDPHPVSEERAPITMGHEFSGVVSEVGADVTAVSEGMPVTVNPIYWCGECRSCREGRYNLCESLGFVGLSGGGGGFAENVVVSEEKVVPLAEDLSLEYGALVEPLAVALHAGREIGLQAGDSVAVFGSGPIGLSVIQVARAAGATPIIVSEPRDARRELAAECGADVLLDPSDVDVVDRVRDETNGGVDVAFEVAGISATYNAAVESTRNGGRIMVVSIWEDVVETHPNTIVLSERTVRGSIAYRGGPRSGEEFGMVVDMLADDRLDPESLITDRIDLDGVVDAGFEALLDETSDQVKILVSP